MPRRQSLSRFSVPLLLGPREQIVALTRRADRQAIFDEIRALYDAGKTVREISGQLGLGRRRVERWVRRIAPPERNIMEPNPARPLALGPFLSVEEQRASPMVGSCLARLSSAATRDLIAISRVFSLLARMPVLSSKKLRV